MYAERAESGMSRGGMYKSESKLCRLVGADSQLELVPHLRAVFPTSPRATVECHLEQGSSSGFLQLDSEPGSVRRPRAMFPTSQLFKELLCPDYTTCKLAPCLFSHTPTTSIPGVRQSQPTAASSSSTVPQKRAGAETDVGPSKTSRNAYAAEPASQGSANSAGGDRKSVV